ncbi:MAG: nucleoside hydrolase [Streptosporangiales bacterium]|nr:nucleoside hydrolase [Streptosporangiales bacterium]
MRLRRLLSLTVAAGAAAALALVSPVVTAAGAESGAAGEPRPKPARLIIDTDIFSDVDDAGALAVAHALADAGQVKLLAVMVDTPSRWGAPAVDAVNTYYGRGDIPVGTLKPVDNSTFEKDYAQVLAKRFPNSLRDGARAPDAVRLYRQVLARQPDHSVTIASVGFLTNLAGLLDSGPDRYSRLSGKALVAEKVKELVVMGGTFPEGREWNFFNDVAATKKVVDEWPTEQVYSGFEVGVSIMTGARLDQVSRKNPVRRGYEIYVGPGNDRESWDLTAVYYAIRGGDELFTESTEPGSVAVHADGSNAWVPEPDRDQRYLTKVAPDETIARVLEDLMLRPPARR